MLDNGYVYLAGTHLSLYRSVSDWAMVIEVFGFSPRSGLPDTHIHTFASTLYNRDAPEKYVSREAYDRYIATNPHNDSRFIYPISEGAWLNGELAAESVEEIEIRNQTFRLPSLGEYKLRGIELEIPPQVQVFELCRFLSDATRAVLATPQEQRLSVLPDMTRILDLAEWHHPDVVNGELPSESETFQQLAQVLVTGEVEHYRPSLPSNTHWQNWPDAGRL